MLFLGAGVSASAADEEGNRPQTWGEFLNQAKELVRNNGDKADIEELIRTEKYLLALEGIATSTIPADFQNLLNQNFNQKSFAPSELHKLVMDLDCEIVVTTNFDKIYDSYCESASRDGYKIVTYSDPALGDLLRSDTRLIIKAHGSINSIPQMIFTRSQYLNAKRKFPQFYELLKALFLTKTCVFIGCSLTDPDILLTLEQVQLTASSTLPHYALVKEGTNSRFEIKDLQDAYNIAVLTYGANHEDLTESLGELRNEVITLRAGFGS